MEQGYSRQTRARWNHRTLWQQPGLMAIHSGAALRVSGPGLSYAPSQATLAEHDRTYSRTQAWLADAATAPWHALEGCTAEAVPHLEAGLPCRFPKPWKQQKQPSWTRKLSSALFIWVLTVQRTQPGGTIRMPLQQKFAA